MANDEPTDAADARVFFGWRLSPYFKNPEYVPAILKRFGPQPEATVREIVKALDTWSIDYGAARKHKPSVKVSAAIEDLRQLERFGRPFLKRWKIIEPRIYPGIITRAMILMTPPDERRSRAFEGIPINPGPALKNLLPVLEWLSDPDNYNAAHDQPAASHKSHKSLERTYLWEPLLRLMEEYGVKPRQHGPFFGAIRSLHLALEIDPPKAEAVRQTVFRFEAGA